MAYAESVLAEIARQAGPTAAAFEARSSLSSLLTDKLLSTLRPEFTECSELRHALEDLFSATSSDARCSPLVRHVDVSVIVGELTSNALADHVAQRMRSYAEQRRALDERDGREDNRSESSSAKQESSPDDLW